MAELKRLEELTLFDGDGLPVEGREPAILANLWGCIFFSMVLIALCCDSFIIFGPSSDMFTYYDWHQKINIFYQFATRTLEAKLVYLAAHLFSLAFWARTFLLSRTFGRHAGVLLVIVPLCVLGFLPLAQLIDYLVFGAGLSLGQLGAADLVTSGTPALFMCAIASLAVALKTFALPKVTVRQYADGLLFRAGSLSRFIGDRAVAWQEIERVYFAKEDSTGKKCDPTLTFVFDKGRTAHVSWSQLKQTGDPAELLNSLRTWAPDAVKDLSFPEDHKVIQQSESYTELWLKYFSSATQRQRSGQLESGVLVCGGKYQVLGSLGAGGQGTAYLAAPQQAEELGEKLGAAQNLVLKEYILPLHRGEGLFQQSMRKLQQEAEILQRIDHPNIVKLHDTFVEDHRGYLVMEFVDGKSLKQIVQEQGKQKESDVIEIAVQVCDVLEYLHSLSPAIIHRDLTPDNLMWQPDGKIKLVDFNVAHQLESSATATVVGKHAYIPPEQFRGKPVEASDIYALGGTLFYLLTATEPEPLTVSRPRRLVEEISEGLDKIIARATAIDTAKRYTNVAEMKADLQLLSVARIKVEREELVADPKS